MPVPDGPLSKVRVVDFTHIFAGPFTTQILGDLGADVVKIERVNGGDSTRLYGLTDASEYLSGPFLAFNRNKRSLAVDLSKEEGRESVRRLIDSADVVVENFSDGVMRRWEFDYETLKTSNPRLIYCSISGFGRVGKLANKAANDLIVQAFSGLLSITGEPDGPPVRCATSISDLSGGLYAAVGILSALFHRASNGVGQLVETSLLESQLNMMGFLFADYWLHGIEPQPMGTANTLGLPNQAFPTADGYVVIASANNAMWQRCCDGLGAPEMAFDDRFATLASRYLHRDELVASVTERTALFTTDECVTALESRGVSCSRINTIPEVATDPQVEALELVAEVPTAGGPPQKVIASPLHLSQAPVPVRRRVPQLGGDSVEVLRELGYTGAEIDRLVADRVVGIPV